METKTTVTQPSTEFILPKETISWHLERELKPDDRKIDKYVVINPGAQDVAKVLKAYAHHPVSGYNIASIEIAYNADLNEQFFRHMKVLNTRKGNPRFVPPWRNMITGDEKAWRETTYGKLHALSTEHRDPRLPNVMLLPLWHGTSDEASGYILDGGYGIFSSNDDPDMLKDMVKKGILTDKGFFGRGIYTAHEAEYAFRVYAQKHGDKAVLLLNWVSTFEAYPVIAGDRRKLEGRTSGYDQCDAHFIPVQSPFHPKTVSYDACAPHQTAQYHEMVVFAYQQCLPRYKVKLIRSAPQPLIEDAASLCYENALGSLKLGQYGSVVSALEDAAEAGHPGALIRLHWWYAGGSGIYPENLHALATFPAVQATSIAELKRKANFRANNDPEAQFTLAWSYQHGLGCEINLAKAAQYYWIAAQQGYRDAQYQLGVCCASGIGVKPEMSQAIHYYEQAAKQGHIHAHYVLSQCYESGLGTKANPTKALEHKQAAQKGKHPLIVGTGWLPLTPISSSSNLQLEQEVKQLKQQLAQQTAVLKEKELQLIQQTSTLKQKESELTQEKLKFQQEQDRAVQAQQKIKELTKAVSEEQQSKDQLIARQKEEEKKKDEIITKQNQEKANAVAQIEAQAWALQQQTQKATESLKELQLTQHRLDQKDEMLTTKLLEIEQLKQDLAELKKREQQLKLEFEAYKKDRTRPLAYKVQTQPNPYTAIFLPTSKSKPVLNSQQQEKQNLLVAACLKGDLSLVQQLESYGLSFSYPNQEGLYPLVAAVYSCSLETVQYVESNLKSEAEKQWSQVDISKAKALLDQWTPIELPKNMTHEELGDWYAKYEGASWCNYYDKECLKKQKDCKKWGGDNGYDDLVWEIGGKNLWGNSSARARWHKYKNDIFFDSRSNKIKKIMGSPRIMGSPGIMWSPSVKVHTEVVQMIRDQLNELRYKIETKVKPLSAAVSNPMLSASIQEKQFDSNYSPASFQLLGIVQLFTSFFSIESTYKDHGTRIACYLNRPALAAMACVNRSFNSFFSQLPKLDSTKSVSNEKALSILEQVKQNEIHQDEIQALLKWVTEGHLVEVETLLKKNPSLGICTGTVTDRSDRTFKQITALQYAAWSLDREMCDLIMNYLGTYHSVMQLKAFYGDPGRYSTHGDHYDIQPLREKTQTYIDNYAKWNDEKCCQYWQKEVGGEQRKCPAWLIYAWGEEGENVAWTTQDFSRKIQRKYDKNRLDWWFTEKYNKGNGVGSTWSAMRGNDPGLRRSVGHLLGFTPYILQGQHNSKIRLLTNADAVCQANLEKICNDRLATLKSLNEAQVSTPSVSTPMKK